MRKRVVLWVSAGLAAVTIGCGPSAPPDTREADSKAVKALEAAWVKDAATKNIDKWLSYYTEDASVLLPNEPVLSGRTAIKASLEPMLADKNFALNFESTNVEASKGGDMVYSVGTYSMTITDEKTRKPVTDKGKYLTVYKKQPDGSWKAVADMLNSDLPANKPAAAATRAPQHKAAKRRGK